MQFEGIIFSQFESGDDKDFEVSCPNLECGRRVTAVDGCLGVAVSANYLITDTAVTVGVVSPDVTEAHAGSGLTGLSCSACLSCAALQIPRAVGTSCWVSLDQLLQPAAEPTRSDGWQPVRSASERLTLYLLSQMVYGQLERRPAAGEPALLAVPREDEALLLWQRGAAVGFASLKQRGQLIDGGPEFFLMDVLDTVFVRRAHRRRGHASQLLEQLLDDQLQQLGLSQPSAAMWKLLLRLLVRRADLRSRLWLVQWTGAEGYRRSVWLELCKRAATKQA